jgi:hypothetical protein
MRVGNAACQAEDGSLAESDMCDVAFCSKKRLAGRFPVNFTDSDSIQSKIAMNGPVEVNRLRTCPQIDKSKWIWPLLVQ